MCVIITVYIFVNPMTVVQLPSVVVAANNGDPTNLKVHLDVPNETLGFRSMSYDYVTKVHNDCYVIICTKESALLTCIL